MKLIENGLVVTMDPQHNIYDRGDIVIRDGQIEYVGPAGKAPYQRSDVQRDHRRLEPDRHARPGKFSQPLPISLQQTGWQR